MGYGHSLNSTQNKITKISVLKTQIAIVQYQVR